MFEKNSCHFAYSILVATRPALFYRVKHIITLIFLNPFLRLVIQVIGTTLIINFLQSLSGNYGLPILIDALPMAALIFLIGNFLKTVVAEAKNRLSNDNVGYTSDLSRLQGAIFCIGIVLGFFTVIS